MAITNTILLAFALIGAVSAQLRAPKVNICVPVGNNTHTPLTVLSTELEKYPGYVNGGCTKVCPTICKAFPLREINAAGQCICKGLSLKCGANAVPSNDKKSCKCVVGYRYKGDAIKGCVDKDECALKNKVCPANRACENTVGSYKCIECGANAKVVNNKCVCDAGFEGDANKGCTDIDKCLCGEDQVCKNTAGSFICYPNPALFVAAREESGSRFTVTSSNLYQAPVEFEYLSTYRGSLFREQRWQWGSFSYKMWGFVPGDSYAATFGFSEIYIPNCNTGYRVFDVIANGASMISKMDVYAAAGCNKAYRTTHSVVANANGEIELTFVPVSAEPTVSFIDIKPDCRVTNNCACEAGFEGDAYNGCDDINECLSEELGYCGEDGVCVNTLGSSKCAFGSDTAIFVDTVPESGPRFTVTSSNIYHTGGTVIGTPIYQGDLFRHQRWGSFTYTIEGFVRSASYAVTLGFSEIYTPNCNTGNRVFDVFANGDAMITNMDIFAVAGCETGYTMTRTVVANVGGEISLQFVPRSSDPTVSFIDIVKL